MKKYLLIVIVILCMGGVGISGGAAWDGESPRVSDTGAVSLTSNASASTVGPLASSVRNAVPAQLTATAEMRRYLEALSTDADRSRGSVETARFRGNSRRVDYSDTSRENIAALKVAAMSGDDESLVALMALTGDEHDYAEQLLQVLMTNATRGSTLALTTLSDWAATGKGFSKADPEASIVFERLAWLTGNDDQEFDFYPTRAGSGWTAAQCRRAVSTVREMASGRQWFDRANGIDGVHNACLIGL